MGSDDRDCERPRSPHHSDGNAQEKKISMTRIYLTLALSIMVFKGAETMYGTTINNYLFKWIYENGRETNFTVLKVAENYSSVPSMCFPNLTIKTDKDIAQKTADKHQTNLLAVASTLSLVSLMVYGCLSDYYGRKMIFIACLSGYIIQLCIACIILNFYAHVNFLYIAYIADGLGGSAFGFSLGCFLSLADIAKTKHEKVLGLALIDSLVGIGGITTKFSTKLYLQSTSYNFPILTACGCCISLLIFTIFFFKDTLYISKEMHPRTSSKHKTKHRPDIKDLFNNLMSFYSGKRDTRSKVFFWLCFVSFCFVESPSVFRSDLLPLIQISLPLCWSRFLTSLYTFCALGSTYVIDMMLMKPLQSVFHDTTIGCIGILSAIMFNFITALAKTTTMMFIGLGGGMLMLVPKPIIRGLASKVAGPRKQGSLFAGLLASELMCEVVSEIVYKFYFVHHGGRVDHELFLALGAVLVPCLLIMLLFRLKFRSVMDGMVTAESTRWSVNCKGLNEGDS